MAEKNTIDYDGLRKILPQAHPFILIDRVEEYVKDVSLVAIKNVTGNEWAFEGNSNGAQYFPETLMIEAAAQAALVLYHVSMIENFQKKPMFIIGKVKSTFLKTVPVGEQLKILVTSRKMIMIGGYAECAIYVLSDKVAYFDLIFKVQG